jgi:hypothetical protein
MATLNEVKKRLDEIQSSVQASYDALMADNKAVEGAIKKRDESVKANQDLCARLKQENESLRALYQSHIDLLIDEDIKNYPLRSIGEDSNIITFDNMNVTKSAGSVSTTKTIRHEDRKK